MKKVVLASLCLTLGCYSPLLAQNVGIKTANPIVDLDVNGDIYLRGDDLYMSHDNATNANNDYMNYNDAVPNTLGGVGIFHFHADEARGAAWTTPTASISADGGYFSGRVGIGTNNPLTITHISGGPTGDPVLRIDADTDNAGGEDDNPRIEMYQDGGTVGVMMGFYDGANNSGNNFRIATRYTNTDDWGTFTIDALSKHVGIGTETPDQRLDINGGGIQIAGAYGIGFNSEIPENGNATGDRAKMYYDNNFYGTNQDALLIEKTDQNNGYPDGGISFTTKSSDNVRRTILNLRGTRRIGLQTVTNPTYALELPNNTAAGTGRARANAWVTYSDGRLKDKRKTIPYGLQTVLNLKPQMYQHHHSTNDKEGNIQISGESSQDVGFIAQELYELVPEAVEKPTDESKDLWAVDYTRLVPVLTKAIQEQNTKIKELETQNTTIQKQYEELKKELQLLKKE
ncbi:MAG: tail fiber domain-containing protein [Aureispira sp.]|nr:tail fiber domain-containing protein [Aureispira sp.]